MKLDNSIVPVLNGAGACVSIGGSPSTSLCAEVLQSPYTRRVLPRSGDNGRNLDRLPRSGDN